MPGGLSLLRLPQFKNGAWREIEDVVTPEEILWVNWPGLSPRRLLAYPENLGDLALGHAALELCPAGTRPSLLKEEACSYWFEPQDFAQPEPGPEFRLSAKEVLSGMAKFMALPGRWHDTGCFHRAALYCPKDKAFKAQAEDIGRHNCIDRLMGWCLREGAATASLCLFVTARATGSLVEKAVRAGFRLMVSRSAVTTAGLRLAGEASLSLLGFSREERFTVFSDALGRIAR